MSLVALVTPDSEAELLTTVALLDAHGHELYRMLIGKLPDTIIMTIDRREVLADLHQERIELKAPVATPRQRSGLTVAPA